MRAIILLATAAFALSTAADASCRDPKTGRFMKCPPAAAASNHCRDKTTKKFAKCGSPNTEPVPVAKK